MLKVGKLTDYATVLATVLAADPARLRAAHELATETHIAEPTVSKVLKLLAKAGVVESLRGAHGGYRLARPAQHLTMADIVRAIDGPLALTECASQAGCCGIEPYCVVRGNWRLINSAIQAALQAVTLEQMAAPMRLRHHAGASMNPGEIAVTFRQAQRS